MSQSPAGEAEPSRSYIEGWSAIYELVRQGKSWSGRERHNCFLNLGNRRFADVSAVAGLDLIDDGRGLAVVDWDQDGALDFWITNRSGPRLRFLRNTAPTDNGHVAFRLTGTGSNRDAIGARLELRLQGDPDRQVRFLHAGDAFLAQSSKWLHFGLGRARPESLTVRWPNGETETFSGLENDQHRYELIEGTGRAKPWKSPRSAVRWPKTTPPPEQRARAGRTFLASRIPLYGLHRLNEDGARQPIRLGPEPVLINLWASWCANCRDEIKAFAENAAVIRRSGLRVLAISVDEEEDRPLAAEALDEAGWEFDQAYAEPDLLELLGIVRQAVVDQPGTLVLPTSFLVDPQRRLAAVYRGPVSVERLVADVELLGVKGEDLRDLAAPFPGRWRAEGVSRNLELLSNLMRSRGHTRVAAAYMGDLRLTDAAPEWARESRADSLIDLGNELAREGNHAEAARSFRQAVDVDPDRAMAHQGLGAALVELGRAEEAIGHHREALRLGPGRGETHFDLGMALVLSGQIDEGEDHFREAVRLSPEGTEPHFRGLLNLGIALGTRGQLDDAQSYVVRALSQKPDLFDAVRYLGYLEQQRRRFDAAILQYQRALELQPGDPLTLLHLGLAQLASGDREGARQQLEALRSLGDPAAEELARQLAGSG